MHLQYRKVPVKYQGKIYAGFISARDRVSVELQLGKRRRHCRIGETVAYRREFDEMILELDAAGELNTLRPDPYLTEIDEATALGNPIHRARLH